MSLKKNESIAQQIMHMDCLGNGNIEIKSLYVENNIFDIDPDVEIYKILELGYFIGDINAQQFTHMFPSQTIWGDSYENLLMRVVLRDSLSNAPLSLSGIVDDLYATCWTLNSTESTEDWEVFSHEQPAVRIKSTPRKLLNALMNTNDKYFMLHHYIGKVLYEEKSELISFFTNQDYSVHLDSLGQGAALSLMRLQKALEHENEVRLVYQFDPSNNPWVENHVICANQNMCKVPMNWLEVLDGDIVVSLSTDDNSIQQLKDALTKNNINLPVKRSIVPDKF